MSLLAITAVITAAMPRILSFGDSWAYLGYDQLRDEFARYGINATRHAIPGTPAGYWAFVEPDGLVDAVEATGADAVYLSVGGNDFLEGLPAGHLVETLFSEMMVATRLILKRLFAKYPHIHVFQHGYEILDWSSCAECEGFGYAELHGPAAKGLCAHTGNVSCMTRAQGEFLQRRFIDEGLAVTYKGSKYYHGYNLLGTLQAAAGVAGAAVGAPVWGQYSPRDMVLKSGDYACVHLTPKGYTALYKELARRAAPHILAEPAATATPPTAVEAGVEERAAEPTARAEWRPCLSNTQRQCARVDERPPQAA